MKRDLIVLLIVNIVYIVASTLYGLSVGFTLGVAIAFAFGNLFFMTCVSRFIWWLDNLAR
jgi:CBS domain containing-hemolysin-like protein